MPVVTTGVYCFFRTVILLKQQTVHVAANCCHGPRTSAVQYAYDAGSSSYIFLYLITCLAQNLCHVSRCLYFTESRLGICMQIRPKHINFFPYIHYVILSFQFLYFTAPCFHRGQQSLSDFIHSSPDIQNPGNSFL